MNPTKLSPEQRTEVQNIIHRCTDDDDMEAALFQLVHDRDSLRAQLATSQARLVEVEGRECRLATNLSIESDRANVLGSQVECLRSALAQAKQEALDLAGQLQVSRGFTAQALAQLQAGEADKRRLDWLDAKRADLHCNTSGGWWLWAKNIEVQDRASARLAIDGAIEIDADKGAGS